MKVEEMKFLLAALLLGAASATSEPIQPEELEKDPADLQLLTCYKYDYNTERSDYQSEKCAEGVTSCYKKVETGESGGVTVVRKSGGCMDAETNKTLKGEAETAPECRTIQSKPYVTETICGCDEDKCNPSFRL